MHKLSHIIGYSRNSAVISVNVLFATDLELQKGEVSSAGSKTTGGYLA